MGVCMHNQQFLNIRPGVDTSAHVVVGIDGLYMLSW